MTRTLARPTLRGLRPSDVARVVEICQATGVFRPDELLIADEVATAAGASADSADPPYYALVAECESRIVGWVCWGATPCTVGTWDLYWMAVDPAAQGSGIGTALVEEMERRLMGVARLIAVDTSGRPDYAPTRAFYEARGYRKTAVVRDFYAAGDDQVIYTKEPGTRSH